VGVTILSTEPNFFLSLVANLIDAPRMTSACESIIFSGELGCSGAISRLISWSKTMRISEATDAKGKASAALLK
jgi:hypothetical protein